jgi:serine/threonine protein kinase
MLTPGRRVSEYVLERRIGGGAFGEVWLARHHVWQRQQVAIKFPRDANTIRQLQREGLAIQKLDHPNIIRALGTDPFADPPYLVMEYAPGGSVRQLIGSQQLAPMRSILLLQQVLAALQHAHERNIIHRDVKPENVLLMNDTLVKLSDFGLNQPISSTMTADDPSLVYSLSVGADAGPAIAGSIEYMSPEQRTGGTVDARTDLYAVGVMMFEMLTGQRPAGTEVPGERNPSIPAGMSAGLDEVFRRAYARIDRRFTSAAQFSDALHRITATTVPPALPVAFTDVPAVHMHISDETHACPRCQRSVGHHDQFCIHCGVQLVAVVRRCENCHAYPDINDTFCIQCGKRFKRLQLTYA